MTTMMQFMPVVLALALGLFANLFDPVNAFTATVGTGLRLPITGAERVVSSATQLFAADDDDDEKAKKDAALQAAIDAMYGGKPLSGEGPDVTKQRIENLIQGNKVVLFMKGTKFFPQCGFSDTATKILEALNVEYEAVDVLSDESIRQGIKEYSQWPTIPQLYIKEEFIGGSDIMINMFESGELQEILNES